MANFDMNTDFSKKVILSKKVEFFSQSDYKSKTCYYK